MVVMENKPTFAATAALLAPWLDHARRYASGYLDDLAEPSDLDGDLWVDWSVGISQDDDEWIRTLETMELLDLMVRADYKAGWALVCEIMDLSLYAGLLDELPEKMYPKHTLMWTDLGADGRASFERAKQLVASIPDGLHTPQFLHVKATMRQLCGMDVRYPSDRVRVCMKLMDLVNLAGDEGAVEDLKWMTLLAMLAQDPGRLGLVGDLQRAGENALQTSVGDAKESREDVFHLDRFTINTRGVTLTDPVLASVTAIEEYGVRLTSMTIAGRSEISPSATAQFVRSLIPSTTSIPMTLSIGDNVDLPAFQAVCSALLVTEKVNNAAFTLQNHQDQYWSWIAYTMFSSEASTRIQYLDLDVKRFDSQALEEVQRVLLARDPLSAIAPAINTFNPHEPVHRLQRNRELVDVGLGITGLVRMGTADTDFSVVSMDDYDRTGLRVVDDLISRTHLCVLCPGVGLCWVRRDAITTRRILPSLTAQIRATAFERISLELSNETQHAALLAFIKLIGPLARILSLSSPDNTALPHDFLCDILTACPNLKRLDLSMVAVPSFSWLLNSGDTTQLSQLTLTRVKCERADGYTQLATALRDTSVGTGRSLQELVIRHHSRFVSLLLPSLVDSLTTNYRIQRIIIQAHSAVRDTALAGLTNQLHSHHGDFLHICDKPIPLTSRLALLSVVGRNASLPELDTAILSIIFAFAASNKRRVCGLVNSIVSLNELL